MTDSDDRTACRRLETKLFATIDLHEAVDMANRFIGERPAVIYSHCNEQGCFLLEVHIIGYGDCDTPSVMAGDNKTDTDGVCAGMV